MNEVSEKELFETMPVHRAVATLAIPTVISQIVSIIYNLADTYEQHFRTLRYDLDTACGGACHASGCFWNVSVYMEEVKPAGIKVFMT